MELIRDAVMLVASGHSSRVVVAGLTFGEDLPPPARALAAERGLRIQPRWTADEVGASLVVETTRGHHLTMGSDSDASGGSSSTRVHPSSSSRTTRGSGPSWRATCATTATW